MPQLRKVRLIIHSWRLPSFREDELRANTRKALVISLPKVFPDLVSVIVDFDNEPIKAVDMEGEVVGCPDEQARQDYLMLMRPEINAVVFGILHRYVVADGEIRARRGALTEVGMEGQEAYGRIELARFQR